MQDNRRESSIELYRIVVMFFIISHHYVVNSNLMSQIYIDPMSWKSTFLGVFGAWGKVGINCFVLITGYFMCESRIKIEKFVKLIFEVEFYKIICWIIFLVLGYETFSVSRIIRLIMPVNNIEQNFTGCYLVFFLFIPFLNILINNMKERQHIHLLMLLGFMYVFFGTVPGLNVSMNYVSWYIVLYFVGAYIKKYPKLIFEKKYLWGVVAITLIGVVVFNIIWCLNNQINAYYLVSEVNTFFAFSIGVSSFLFVKNLKLNYNKWINKIASTTFGVLQIHANSDAMRTWLWIDTLRNVEMYNSPWLILHALGSVICIFGICSIIDLVRQKVIEKPLFDILHKNKLWCKIINITRE